jgi:serine kinase of HPr protein (carbohydrate metabolism regulator)
MSARTPVNIHASAILIGAAGLLLRGASGAGKSSLALDLVDLAAARGLYAALVADDRVEIVASGGRLVARAPASLAGRVEMRGIGILKVAHEPACVLRTVIDLIPEEPARMPAGEDRFAVLEGVRLNRIATKAGDPRAAALALRAWCGAIDAD